MKKFILPFIAVLLLSACSDKFSLQKRLYNKGFYFAKTHHRQNKQSYAKASGIKVHDIALETAQNTGQELKASEPQFPPTGNKVENKAITKTSEKQAISDKKENQQITVSATNALAFPGFQFKNLSKQMLIISDSTKAGDSGVMLILLVLLAIFIPPLAVFLKAGSINKWFWITLILCLLSFTIFFFVFGGLLWLVAIVIALLYVLDML